jgi:hypothetical protein
MLLFVVSMKKCDLSVLIRSRLCVNTEESMIYVCKINFLNHVVYLYTDYFGRCVSKYETMLL